VAGGIAAGAPSAADRALVKLNRVLPAALRERVTALLDATAVTGTPRPVLPPEPELALTLATAVRERRRVRIEHRELLRDVDPYGLVVHARRWYLVGHDHLRDGLRTFRVDRIGTVSGLPQRFDPPDGFDPVAHLLRTLTLDAWTHRTEVWLDTDLATARSRLPVTTGELHADPDGGVVLVSGVNDLAGMALMLAGLPWPFTVRRPAALGDEVGRRAAALAEAAARSASATSGTGR